MRKQLLVTTLGIILVTSMVGCSKEKVDLPEPDKDTVVATERPYIGPEPIPTVNNQAEGVITPNGKEKGTLGMLLKENPSVSKDFMLSITEGSTFTMTEPNNTGKDYSTVTYKEPYSMSEVLVNYGKVMLEPGYNVLIRPEWQSSLFGVLNNIYVCNDTEESKSVLQCVEEGRFAYTLAWNNLTNIFGIPEDITSTGGQTDWMLSEFGMPTNSVGSEKEINYYEWVFNNARLVMGINEEVGVACDVVVKPVDKLNDLIISVYQ